MQKQMKRWLGILLAVVMMVSAMPTVTIWAAEDKYPYTIFASSNQSGAISINADSLCINGSIATNGTIKLGTTGNVNGEKEEHAGRNMPLISGTINEKFFNTGADRHSGDYISDETNVNLNKALVAVGSVNIQGNANLNAGVKAAGNITISGQTMNANNCVLYSATGDIHIESDNVSFTGLIYAPTGEINIKAQNLNLNSIILIAETVTLQCGGANINYNDNLGKIIGEGTQGGSGSEQPAEPTKVPEQPAEPTETPEQPEEELQLPDADGDGIPDETERILGTDIHEADSDGDGLKDYEELFILGTDPGNADEETDRDTDGDGLTNAEESRLGTNLYLKDTDGDGLSDYEETKHKLNPLETDTDKDGLSDWDEITLGTNPNKQDSDADGIADGEEIYEQKLLEQCFEEELLENNAAVPSLSFASKGNVSADVAVSLYDGHLKGDARFFVGEAIEISGSELDAGQLEFKLTEETDNAENLLICYYNGEITTPLKTKYDSQNQMLSADISGEGIYFVLQTEEWLESLGLNREPVATMSLTRETAEEAPKQADIVFLMEADSTLSAPMLSVQESVLDIAENLEDAGIMATYSYIVYRSEGSTMKPVSEIPSDGWFMNALDFRNVLSLVVTNTGQKLANREQAAALAEHMCKAASAQVFYVYVTAEGCEIISKESKESIFLTDAGLTEAATEVAETITEQVTNGYWILLNGLVPKAVRLDKKPEKNSQADTDWDGLPDAEELRSLTPWCYLDAAPYKELMGMENSYIGTSLPVYVYYSNPASIDTDGDDIDDEEEMFMGTDPANEDTDWDGMSDGLEVVEWYDPLNANPDGDSYNDYEEFSNGTNPYSHDMDLEEIMEGFSRGVLCGDALEDPNMAELMGQMAIGIVPVVGVLADVRDTIANAVRGEWFMAGVSVLGVVSGAGDLAKVSSKIGEFILKNIDKTDEMACLLVKLATKYPDIVAKIVSGVSTMSVTTFSVRSNPISIVDELFQTLGQKKLYSREFYEGIVIILESAQKTIPTVLTEFPNAVKITYEGVSPWKYAHCTRGKLIDVLLGNNLGEFHKTYDHFDKATKIATSYKSMDFMCKSYQDVGKFKSRIRHYANELLKGDDFVTIDKRREKIEKKVLNLIFPDAFFDIEYKKALTDITQEFEGRCEFIFTVIP